MGSRSSSHMILDVFFFSLASSSLFWVDWQVSIAYILSFVAQNMCNLDRTAFIGHTFFGKCFCQALFSFCMCEGDIPCALEKLVMAELSQLWGSYSFTNRNISPLLQYLWPPNLARWWLTIGAPTHKVTWSLIAWSWEIVWQVKVISPLPQDLWPLNLVVWISEKLPLVGYWIHGGASERKRQSRHRRLVVFFSFFFWSLLENWQARSFFGVYLIGRSQILFHLKVELKDAKIKWRKLLNF